MKNLIRILLFTALFSGCQGSLDNSTYSAPIAPATRSANLTWTAGTGVITGYKIEWSTDNHSFTLAQTVGNTTTATVPGLIIGKTYYFRVKTYNTGGDSAATSVVSVASVAH